MSDLPREGPGRQILLQALLEFSDNCEMPALNANCPFSELVEGGRVCGEECMDLLAQHGPVRAFDEIQLGDGFIERSRRNQRARRPGPQHFKPYDCAEVKVSDRDLPPARRRLAALLNELIELWGTAPPDDTTLRSARKERLSEITAELEARDIDVERLGREIGHYLVAAGICAAVGIPFVAGAIDGSDLDDAGPEAVQTWRRLILPNLSPDSPQDRRDAFRRVWGRMSMVAAALAETDLEALGEWRAPEQLPDEGLPPPPAEDLRWLMDRFTQTYLADWAATSLFLEWRYLHGQAAGPCSPEYMKERHVDEGEVARAIADHATERHALDRPGIETGQHISKAVEMIRAGRRASAAAVFESIAELQPNDPQAFNNWGFCVLPDDAAHALPLLQRASELGLGEAATNVGNRVLCLARVGRLASALSLAERYWNAVSPPPQPAFMWHCSDLGSGELELTEVQDCHEYVARIAAELAAAAGDPGLASDWSDRAAERRGESLA